MSDIFNCEIIKKSQCFEYTDLMISAPEIAEKCRPGQFLHIDCGKGTTLRRPISICEVAGTCVRVVFQVKGKGTKALSECEEGEFISVLGPLGNGFDFSGERVLLIGGGLGVFPLLQAAKTAGKNSVAILGFRSADAVYLKEDFEKYCREVYISTDDGTAGEKGFVTDIQKRIICGFDLVMTCGPDIMMKNVSAVCRDNDINCQVSLEERMGCGTGVCLCCTRTVMRGGEPDNLCVCKEGPVFDSREVYF